MGASEIDLRLARRARALAVLAALVLECTHGRAENRAAFPTEPSGPPPRQPTPAPQYPPPQYPPQQYPPQQYPPQQYPPQQPQRPPQQYPPQQYPPQQPQRPPQQYPQQYPPQQYPPQQPQRPPQQYPPQQYPQQYQYPQQVPQQQYPQQVPQQQYPQQVPQQQFPPGYVPPGYGAQPPPEPQNPALGADMRYRQELGTYQRPNYAMAPNQNQNQASNAYVKLEDKKKHRHDGLYFRFGLGVGRAHDAMSTAEPIQTDRELSFFPTPFDGSGTATSPVTELAFGFAVGAGITLGVGSYTATLPKLKTEVVQRETGEYLFRLSQLALIGPFIDWYFDEESGFHAQASPGVSTFVAGAGEPKIAGPQAQAHTAVGFGFMLGVGYDWWVSDQWSVGLLGRIQYGTMNGTAPTPDGVGVEFHHTAYAPAILVTATYQ